MILLLQDVIQVLICYGYFMFIYSQFEMMPDWALFGLHIQSHMAILAYRGVDIQVINS